MLEIRHEDLPHAITTRGVVSVWYDGRNAGTFSVRFADGREPKRFDKQADAERAFKAEFSD